MGGSEMIDGTREGTPLPLALAGAFFMVGLAACGDGASGPFADEPIVRDSAGVTIVENPSASSFAPAWRIADEPSVEIGILEGAPEQELFRVVGALRLAGERIAVANAGTSEVRVYDAEGVHLASWGGEGEGPGEFVGIAGMMRWAGDSLAVWDLRTRRITVFDETEGYGRTFAIPATEGMNLPRPEGRLDSGALVLGEVRFGGTDGTPESGLQRAPVHVVAVAPDGSTIGDLGAHPGPQVHMNVSEQAVSIFTPDYALRHLLLAAGDEVLVSPSERFELRFWDLEGMLTRVARLDEPRHAVTSGDRDRYLAGEIEDAPPERHAGIRARVEQFPVPDTLPAMDGVVRDATGHLWVEPFQLEGQEPTKRWVVVDPEGMVAATITLPAGLDVYDIGPGHLVAADTDELGVERVRVWPLTRAP